MSQWTGKSYGGYWGNLCFLKLLKLGLAPAYVLLAFVAAYFMVFRRRAFAGAVEFLSRVNGRKVGAFSAETYKLLFTFGACLLDRTSVMLGESKISMRDECRATLEDAMADGRGVVVLTAHVGGWAAAGTKLSEYGREVVVLGADRENPELQKLAESARKIDAPKIFDDGSLGYVEAYAALKRGAIVAIHADRYAGGRFAEAEFFGSKVKAPTAAFSLAKTAKVKAVQIICTREKKFEYAMRASEVFDPAKTPPDDCARAFMKNLETALRKYKYQWFNFYDFWN